MDETKEKLTRFYNKFNENKRLDTRHGQVEFFTSIKYIHDYLKPGDRIADIGAGPGKYSLFLKQEGYDVTAVELVRPNIGMLRAKDFDAVILFGPMYHLYSFEDRLQALKEAARICKRVLFVTYIMNEYALIQYAFKENNYSLIKDKLDKDFRICDPDGIFFQTRLEEMDELNKACGLKSTRWTKKPSKPISIFIWQPAKESNCWEPLPMSQTSWKPQKTDQICFTG